MSPPEPEKTGPLLLGDPACGGEFERPSNLKAYCSESTPPTPNPDWYLPDREGRRPARRVKKGKVSFGMCRGALGSQRLWSGVGGISCSGGLLDFRAVALPVGRVAFLQGHALRIGPDRAV
jgi:hypothetical protein